jgi:hypothetical protein
MDRQAKNETFDLILQKGHTEGPRDMQSACKNTLVAVARYDLFLLSFLTDTYLFFFGRNAKMKLKN